MASRNSVLTFQTTCRIDCGDEREKLSLVRSLIAGFGLLWNGKIDSVRAIRFGFAVITGSEGTNWVQF